MDTRLQACFDFHVRSEIALPELAAPRTEEDRPVVDIRIGAVPPSLPGGGDPSPHSVQYDGSRVLLTVPEVARFLIEGGRAIVVDPAPNASESAVRLFLLGSAIGIVGHMRGLLLLHANAVQVGDDVCAFAGESGAGKSTLAGRFAAAGYAVLSDDVCAVRFDDAGRPVVWPGVPRLKLWSDAADWLGHGAEGRERVREGFDKFLVPVIAPAPEALPLAKLYELARAEDAPSIDPLAGREAVGALLAHTYRREYLPVLGLAQRHFALVARLASAIRIYRWRRVWGYRAFDDEFARLCEHAAAPVDRRAATRG